MRRKEFGRRVASMLVSLGIMGTMVFSLGITASAARDYSDLEALGIKEYWHYNAILFGDWVAKQADVEGAIAVKGNVRTAEAGPFSVGANVDHKVMGGYDPSVSKYPIAIFGFNGSTTNWVASTTNLTDVFGDVVMRQSAQSYYQGMNKNKVAVRGDAVFKSDDLVDSFFAEALNMANGIFSYFQKGVTGNGGIYANTDGSGREAAFNQSWNTTLMNKPASEFEAAGLQGADGEKVLIIDFLDEGAVNLGALHMGLDYEEYDTIVLNFPKVSSATFTQSSNIHLGTSGPAYVYGVYRNDVTHSVGGATYQRMEEWTNRMVWLFPNASNISVAGGAVVGSVIAPNATVLGSGGNINGMLFAKDLEQQKGFELHAFWLNKLARENVEPDPDPEPEPEYRELSIAKYDEEIVAFPAILDNETTQLVTGAEIKLQYLDEETNTWIYYYEDDTRSKILTEDGIVTLYDLQYGVSYRLEERLAPPGYQVPKGQAVYTYFDITATGEVIAKSTYYDKDGNELLIYDAGSETLRVFNRKLDTQLRLIKVDGDTKEPLKNAVFGLRQVFEDGNYKIINNAIATGDDGLLPLPALTAGTYMLFEHTAPAGYEQPSSENGEYYTITITQKEDDGTGEYYLETEITDWNGSQLVPRNDGEDIVYDVYNYKDVDADNSLRIEFIKIDSSNQPLAGAVFEVYTEVLDPEDGYDFAWNDVADLGPDSEDTEGSGPEPVEMRYWKFIDEFTSSGSTGDYGYIYTQRDIQVGDAFLLIEKEAPAGYKPWGRPRIFTVGEDENVEGKYVFRYFFENNKEDAVLGSFTFEKVDDELEPNPVQGASFMLFREVNGSYVFTGRSVTLSDRSQYTSEALPAGRYVLYESYLPVGYEAKTEEERETYFVIDVNAEGQSGSGTEDDPYIGRHIGAEKPVQIENIPYRVTFGIVKLDRATNEPMGGVTFKVYRRTSILEEWQLFVDKEHPDGLFTTDSQGKVSSQLREGMYKLEEIETWDGYKITSAMYYTVERGVTPEVIELRVFNEKQITGEAEVYKVDAEDTSKQLYGSRYQLYSAPDDEYRYVVEDLKNGDVTMEEVAQDDSLWTPYPNANKNTFEIPEEGKLVIDGLESGLYKLVEIEPPEGYALWDSTKDSILFEMAYDSVKGEQVVYLGEIFGNHIEPVGDAAIVFANEAKEDPEDPDPEDPDPEDPDPEDPEDPDPEDPDPEDPDPEDPDPEDPDPEDPDPEDPDPEDPDPEDPDPEDPDPEDPDPEDPDPEDPDPEDPDPEDPDPEDPKEPGSDPIAYISVFKVDHYDNTVALPGTVFRLQAYTGSDADALLPTLLEMENAPVLKALRNLYSWANYPTDADSVFVTGADGGVELAGLDCGIYRVTEIQPPAGYALWGDERDTIYLLVDFGVGRMDLLNVTVVGNHVDGVGVTFADAPIPTDGAPEANPIAATGDSGEGMQILYMLLAASSGLLAVFLFSVKRYLRAKRNR